MLFHNLINVGVQKKQLKSKSRNSHRPTQLPIQRAQPNLPGIEAHVNQIRPTEKRTGQPNHSGMEVDIDDSKHDERSYNLRVVEPFQLALQRAQPSVSGMDVDIDHPIPADRGSGLRVMEPSQKLALQRAQPSVSGMEI
jgi:hypothetical protein